MKFRRKPIIVEAFKWTGGPDQTEDPEWIVNALNSEPWQARIIKPNDVIMLEIMTLEGQMCANVGDYIIRDIKGEIYPCKPNIFEQTYEPVQALNAQQPEPTELTKEIRYKAENLLVLAHIKETQGTTTEDKEVGKSWGLLAELLLKAAACIEKLEKQLELKKVCAWDGKSQDSPLCGSEHRAIANELKQVTCEKCLIRIISRQAAEKEGLEKRMLLLRTNRNEFFDKNKRLEEKVAELKKQPGQNFMQALKAVQIRTAFIGHPNEPMNKAGPDWSKEIALLKTAIAEFKQPESHPFYTCEFCGCNTNAHFRKCCQKGFEADVKKSEPDKQPEPTELAEELRGVADYTQGTKMPPPSKAWSIPSLLYQAANELDHRAAHEKELEGNQCAGKNCKVCKLLFREIKTRSAIIMDNLHGLEMSALCMKNRKRLSNEIEKKGD